MKHQLQLAVLLLVAVVRLDQASYYFADASTPISSTFQRQPFTEKQVLDRESSNNRSDGIDFGDENFRIYDNDYDQIDLNEVSNQNPYEDVDIESLYGSKSDDGIQEGSEYDQDQENYGQATEKGALYDAYNLLHTLAQVRVLYF